MKLIPAIRKAFEDKRSVRFLAIMLSILLAGHFAHATSGTGNVVTQIAFVLISWTLIGIGGALFIRHEKKAFGEFTKVLEGEVKKEADPDDIREFGDILNYTAARLHEEASIRKMQQDLQ